MTQSLKASVEAYICNQPSIEQKVNAINELRQLIHELSPFRNEPVDFVKWVPSASVVANDYNPNKVAPPEMQLLEISIMNDGYTQPIVTWPHDDKIEVVDGFHRNRVGKESNIVKQRIHGFLPTVAIKQSQSGINDRIASTIRHNRARGKHTVNAMSDIVIELKNRNWLNDRIAKELGMDNEEILRLCQISGLEELFKDDDFSKSWMIEDSSIDSDGFDIQELIDEEEKLQKKYRTVNTSDETRIFHTFDKWECYQAGFYNSTFKNYSKSQCEYMYFEFLSNLEVFESALSCVISEWKYSCEHYLTNKSMNRIAWLGQASMCYHTGVPSEFRGGYNLLSEEQKDKANNLALKYLNIWLLRNGLQEVSIDEAQTDKQTNIY